MHFKCCYGAKKSFWRYFGVDRNVVYVDDIVFCYTMVGRKQYEYFFSR